MAGEYFTIRDREMLRSVNHWPRRGTTCLAGGERVLTRAGTMDEEKRKRLEVAGWKTGTAAEFFGLTKEEEAIVAMKLERERLRAAVVEAAKAHRQSRAIGHASIRITSACRVCQDEKVFNAAVDALIAFESDGLNETT
jgi:hypothetical protein